MRCHAIWELTFNNMAYYDSFKETFVFTENSCVPDPGYYRFSHEVVQLVLAIYMYAHTQVMTDTLTRGSVLGNTYGLQLVQVTIPSTLTCTGNNWTAVVWPPRPFASMRKGLVSLESLTCAVAWNCAVQSDCRISMMFQFFHQVNQSKQTPPQTENFFIQRNKQRCFVACWDTDFVCEIHIACNAKNFYVPRVCPAILVGQ